MKHIKAFEHFFLPSNMEPEVTDDSENYSVNPPIPEDEKGGSCNTCETPDSSTEDGNTEEEKNPTTWGDEKVGPIYVESFAAFFEGKKKMTKKEIAEVAPPYDKITQRDIIELRKKGGKTDKSKNDEKEEKDSKPKFGSKEWQEKYGKKKKK